MISFDSEKALEDLLFENQEFLFGRFSMEDYQLQRQVTLGAYGTADLVATRYTHDKSTKLTWLDVVIFELKNTPISHAHLSQLARYKRFFEHVPDESDLDDVYVRGILIGSQTFPSKDDLVFLCQDIEWLEVYEFALDPLKGLSFRRVSNWLKTGHEQGHTDAFLASLDRRDIAGIGSIAEEVASE